MKIKENEHLRATDFMGQLFHLHGSKFHGWVGERAACELLVTITLYNVFIIILLTIEQHAMSLTVANVIGSIFITLAYKIMSLCFIDHNSGIIYIPNLPSQKLQGTKDKTTTA